MEHKVCVTFLSQRDLGAFVLDSSIVMPDVTYSWRMGQLMMNSEQEAHAGDGAHGKENVLRV